MTSSDEAFGIFKRWQGAPIKLALYDASGLSEGTSTMVRVKAVFPEDRIVVFKEEGSDVITAKHFSEKGFSFFDEREMPKPAFVTKPVEFFMRAVLCDGTPLLFIEFK